MKEWKEPQQLYNKNPVEGREKKANSTLGKPKTLLRAPELVIIKESQQLHSF